MRTTYLTILILALATSGGFAACKKAADPAGGSGGGGSSGVAPSEGDLQSVTASSALTKQDKTYAASALMDGGDASWCEGKSDDGLGETFTLTFGESVTLKTFRVRNGMGDPKLYSAGNRVKKLLVNGVKVKLKDDPKFQTVTLPKAVTGETIKFEIGSVHRGAKSRETCITEIAIEGVKAPANSPTPKPADTPTPTTDPADPGKKNPAPKDPGKDLPPPPAPN